MEVTLNAQARTETGKGPAHRARENGQIPAVLYGSSVESTALIVDEKQMRQALRTEAGSNVLINLVIDSSKYLTIPRAIQRHPISRDILHVDFVNVARDVQIHAEVPVHLIGESHGVKEGGQVDHHVHELKVMALPTDVPAAIEVDITELGIGEGLKVSELKIPSEVEVLNDPEDLVVAVIEPTVMEVEAPEEEAVVAEGEADADESGKDEKDDGGAEQEA